MSSSNRKLFSPRTEMIIAEPDLQPAPRRPAIACPEIPAFAAEDDLGSIRAAFQPSPARVLRQAWRENEEADFAPATVRLGWRGEMFLVFAELTDADIATTATAPNERLWELGDAFEMFLKASGQDAYVEFQVAPNNQRLQMRFGESLSGVLLPGELFRSRTWVQPESQQWFVFAQIPAASIDRAPASLRGAQWRCSFARYDYTRGRREPVISSTSPHTRPDFHRQQEWDLVRFGF